HVYVSHILIQEKYAKLNETHKEKLVLLDTTQEATLEWTRYPYGPQANTPGWLVS
ncbi:hypothetical protein L9F63_000896, partial [Diploptera punctata]